MASYSPGERGHSPAQRGASIALTGGVHASAVLAALLVQAETPAQLRPHALVTFDVAKPPRSEPPSTPARPKAAKRPVERLSEPPPVTVSREPVSPSPELSSPPLAAEIMAMLQAANDGAGATGCDLTAPVQAALRLSEAVQARLPTIPGERLSVANAAAMWMGDWVKPDAMLDEQTLGAIRETVVATVSAASEACRRQEQGGPRFVFLPAGERTTILAFGSGTWAWQTLVDTAPAQSGTDAATGDASNQIFAPRSAVNSDPASVNSRSGQSTVNARSPVT